MSENDNLRQAIATRLRAAREQSGLSQGQAAKLLKMQRPTVSEIEAGRRRVAADELVEFAHIYGVSISWLAEEKSDVADPAAELAARELAKLKPQDFDNVMKLLRTLRKSGGDPK